MAFDPITCHPVEEPDLVLPYVKHQKCFTVDDEKPATEDGQFDDPWSELGQESLPSKDGCEDVSAADMDDASDDMMSFDGPNEEIEVRDLLESDTARPLSTAIVNTKRDRPLLCPDRVNHMLKMDGWIGCDVCRQELVIYARQLAREG
jgi:hypothetical protein